MLAIMIAQLLEKAPLGITKDAVQDDPTVAAIVGGTDVQHAIVAGAGARPVDSSGTPVREATSPPAATCWRTSPPTPRTAAAEGTWASGPTPDGKGEFSYHDGPTSTAPMPPPTHPDSRFYGTTELPNIVEKAAGGIQDAMKKE